jgi:diaminopimelate epimerase
MCRVSRPPNPDFVGLTFVKGHGTQNDFIVYADPDGTLPLDAPTAAWLADRRTGIGADGVIRAVRTTAARDLIAGLGVEAFEAEWFMDYRNADGSIAEMCGNGARVFVEFLRAAGLVDVPDGKPVAIGTRGGVRRVWCRGEDYGVEMGRWTVPGGASGVGRGDVEVTATGLDAPKRGVRVNVPNPHVVVTVSAEELANLDLSIPPTVSPMPEDGANVEFIVVDSWTAPEDTASGAPGRIHLRVWERGVGETKSCGTGVVAGAIVAALRMAGAPGRWSVDVPGGTLQVQFTPRAPTLTSLDDAVPSAILTGPALLVFQGGIIPYTTD